MNKQYYIREGRRFIKADVPSVVDYRGMYYNVDGTFSKERTNDSIGVCIIQTPTEAIVCSLKEWTLSRNEVKNLLKEHITWRLGEQEERHIAIKYYRQILNLQRGVEYRINFCFSGGIAYYGARDDLFYFHADNVSSYTPAHIGGRRYEIRLFKTVSLCV